MSGAADLPILVVGAGVMGLGIAQVAAQAGHPVMLQDNRPGAAADAVARLGKTFDTLVARGKLSEAAAREAHGRITAVDALEQAGGAGLVIEAIVEQLEVKRQLFRTLEDIVGEDCVLATNTSSISVTAMANGLRRPQRVVGMHFFNPVPLMKLVEVVHGLQTDPAVAERIEALSVAWGKTPVHARSTPGFIVNRIARPYYAETLALLQEQAASPWALDACLRAVGFRMGPCELMDLIGHDTNFAVTQSVFEANFYDKRYVPSLVQRELVAGGLLGRKSGQGFYRYGANGSLIPPTELEAEEAPAGGLPVGLSIGLHGQGPAAQALAQRLSAAGMPMQAVPDPTWVGLRLSLPDGTLVRLQVTDGRTAHERRAELRERGEPVTLALMDAPQFAAAGAHLAWTTTEDTGADLRQVVEQVLRSLGWVPVALADAPGLVVTRTLAMLINEAADAVHQGVCNADGADAAMKLGVNYPAGPFEWLRRWEVGAVVGVINALDHFYRGERYRVSPLLLRQKLA